MYVFSPMSRKVLYTHPFMLVPGCVCFLGEWPSSRDPSLIKDPHCLNAACNIEQTACLHSLWVSWLCSWYCWVTGHQWPSPPLDWPTGASHHIEARSGERNAQNNQRWRWLNWFKDTESELFLVHLGLWSQLWQLQSLSLFYLSLYLSVNFMKKLKMLKSFKMTFHCNYNYQ